MTDKVEVEEKVNSGLQSAVRYGFMTAQEAYDQLGKAHANGYYVRASIMRWLKQRIKK